MDIEKTTLIFIVAFVSGSVGSEAGHKIKKLSRSLYIRLAVDFACGFSAALLTLVFFAGLANFGLSSAILLGLIYGYFISNAKAFNFE